MAQRDLKFSLGRIYKITIHTQNFMNIPAAKVDFKDEECNNQMQIFRQNDLLSAGKDKGNGWT